MLQRIKKNRGGFTIIEVLIVLAIAALILVIVFLAVPALQRSARNTQRRTDVSAMIAAVSNYISDNNGQLPDTVTITNANSGTFTASCLGSLSTNGDTQCTPNANTETAQMGFYNTTADTPVYEPMPAVGGNIVDPVAPAGTTQGTPATFTTNNVLYYPGVTCNGNSKPTYAPGAFTFWYIPEGTTSVECLS